MTKPKIKFLTAVWGHRYIEEFAQISLPSFLAPGNLPALSEIADLEVLILTSKASVTSFRRQPSFRILESLVHVRFIFIDDLITQGVYGVTLTLAYARGIMDSGPEQTNTYFLFMNSDFVLADGSLKSAGKMILQGHNCILAPSLRACAEAVLPNLTEMVDCETSQLILSPRQMVRMALDDLHPTTIGKTVTQNFVNCRTHNQIYWQVDERTLLARHHLIFMLVIKPERPMTSVNSYCDYGFVPEMIPSGQISVLGDSDDFFMLELQNTRQEQEYLRCGKASIDEIAAELSVWTTAEHRRAAEFDVVFHAGDLPARLQAVQKEATRFITQLHEKMTTPPVSHVNHYYWVSGVEAWRAKRDYTTKATQPLPPELEETSSRASKLQLSYRNALRYLRRWIPRKPRAPLWRHDWPDSQLIRNWIEAHGQETEKRSVLVCSPDSALMLEMPSYEVVSINSVNESLLGQPSRDANARKYDRVFCHIQQGNIKQVRQVLEGLRPLLNSTALIGVYIDNEGYDLTPVNFSYELASYVPNILPAGWTGYCVKASFAGGILKRSLRRWELYFLNVIFHATPLRIPAFPVAAAGLPVVWGLTALRNWWSRSQISDCPDFCSSALIVISKESGV